jgi:hypothetical protein
MRTREARVLRRRSGARQALRDRRHLRRCHQHRLSARARACCRARARSCNCMARAEQQARNVWGGVRPLLWRTRMSLPRYAARRDANEHELVTLARQLGAQPEKIGPLDWWIGWRSRWVPLEIKTDSKVTHRVSKPYTEKQVLFLARCKERQLTGVDVAHRSPMSIVTSAPGEVHETAQRSSPRGDRSHRRSQDSDPFVQDHCRQAQDVATNDTRAHQSGTYVRVS